MRKVVAGETPGDRADTGRPTSCTRNQPRGTMDHMTIVVAVALLAGVFYTVSRPVLRGRDRPVPLSFPTIAAIFAEISVTATVMLVLVTSLLLLIWFKGG